MTDIKELALRVAKESPWYYDNEPVGDSDAIDFAKRFLAAYLAEQEPVGFVDDSDEGGMWAELYMPPRVKCGDKLYTAPPLPETAPDEEWRVARSEALAALYGAREVLGDVANIQHAIDLLSKTEKKYKPACAAPSSEEVIALKQLWLADLEQATAELHSTPQSSSEEVREMVRELLDDRIPMYAANRRAAADMIERLAARVPDGCVVVPKDPLDAAKNLLAVKGRHHTELAYKQLCQAWIAAREVKP